MERLTPSLDTSPLNRGLGRTLHRVAFAILIVLASVNIWTGSPLIALWVGSQVQASQGGLSMLAVAVVLIVLAVLVLSLSVLLGRLGARYDQLMGRPPPKRQQAAWLKSMRAERPERDERRKELTFLERVMVATVVVAVGLMEFWFFFMAGSPLGSF